MSGIEIAGLVLGAFPLLIHALESYRESLDILKDWYKIQRAYRHSIRTLGILQVQFERNVERFLLPLVVDDDELKELMANPAGKGWEDPDLETRLQQRLPESYKWFLETIVEINRIVEALKKELGVTNHNFQARVNEDGALVKIASRVDLMSRANFDFQTKRIKFSLKRSTRERLFGQLEKECNQMQTLLELDDQVTTARQQRSVSKSASTINRKMSDFWRHAKRLHEALTKAWQCSCPSHTVNLGLAGLATGKIEFDIIFRLKGTIERSTRIKMADTNNVSIAVSQNSSHTKVQWSAPRSLATQIYNQPVSQIDNLCSALVDQCTDCIGFIEEDDYRFIFYHDTQATLSPSVPTISLQDILPERYVLTRRKRYGLALTLAISFLRLGATPWLDRRLHNDNIVFLANSNDPLTADLDSPYITREMSANVGAQPTDALASLGIRLLELCFGDSLKEMQVRKKLGTGDTVSAPVLDWAAAIEWSKSVSDEAGLEFAGAIDWCLHGNELTDTDWRHGFIQNVVLPLQSCLKYLS